MTTLKDPRSRGDLIHKLQFSKNEVNFIHPNQLMPSTTLKDRVGNVEDSSQRLYHQNKNVVHREIFFSNRIVPFWSDLPNEVT